jgi:hypothetical protein
VLVIVPPLNVTSPSPIETTPPSPCAQPSRTRRRLRPKPPPLRPRATAPTPIAARPAHLCFGAGYRHAVEQRGALVHAEHAATAAAVTVLRTSATRRTLGEGVRPPPPSSSTCDAQRTTRSMRNATTADPSYAACIACSMRSGPAVAPHAVQQAPSDVHQGRYHSTVHLPHGMQPMHANEITLINTRR